MLITEMKVFIERWRATPRLRVLLAFVGLAGFAMLLAGIALVLFPEGRSTRSIGAASCITEGVPLPNPDDLPDPPTVESNLPWKSYKQLLKEGKVDPLVRVLWIYLDYDASRNPGARIQRVERSSGYPDPPSRWMHDGSDEYLPEFVVQVLGKDNTKLSEQRFFFSLASFWDGADENGNPTGGIITSTTADTLVALPWCRNGAVLRLTDADGRELGRTSLANVPMVETTPVGYWSLSGADLPAPTSTPGVFPTAVP